MFDTAAEKMSAGDLVEIKRYTDGYAMRLQAQFPAAACIPGVGVTCLGDWEHDL